MKNPIIKKIDQKTAVIFGRSLSFTKCNMQLACENIKKKKIYGNQKRNEKLILKKRILFFC
jgi:hypothetical protein